MGYIIQTVIVTVIVLSIILSIVFWIRDAINKHKKKKRMAAKRMELLQQIRDKKLISEERYQKIAALDERNQIRNINRMCEYIQQNQRLMEIMNLNMMQLEEQRRAATGMEFGGYNPDPYLNPGMQMAQQQIDQMAHQQAMEDINRMNDMNNMNNMGMF